jgi:hypothetical protein
VVVVIIEVDVNVDIVVVAVSGDVIVDLGVVIDGVFGGAVVVSGVDNVVVTDDDGAWVVIMVSGLVGAKIRSFNSRERVTAHIVRTMRDTQTILTHRYCHHFRGPILLLAYSLNN